MYSSFSDIKIIRSLLSAFKRNQIVMHNSIPYIKCSHSAEAIYTHISIVFTSKTVHRIAMVKPLLQSSPN